MSAVNRANRSFALSSAIARGIEAMRRPAVLAAASLVAVPAFSAIPDQSSGIETGPSSSQRSLAARSALVAIDPSVGQAEALRGGLPASAAAVRLPVRGDALAALGVYAHAHPGVRELHLFSHGEPGALWLSGQRIDAETLLARSDEVRGLLKGSAIDTIVLYGCSAGAGGSGSALMQTLAALTGATVVASDDPTGHADRGGDWTLERSTGDMVESIVSVDGQRQFRGLLATFTVSNTDDDGAGSLRQAVLDANSNPGLDVVDASGVNGTITLTTGQMEISDSVAINGPGREALTVSGNGNDRIFSIVTGAEDVSISDVTLTEGYTDDGGQNRGYYSDANGGAIFNNSGGDLTITDAAITASRTGKYGGGIYQGGGNLTIQNSVITGNQSDTMFGGGGGGVFFNAEGGGNFTLSGSTVESNTTEYGFGGGLYISGYASSGSVSITDSTISSNQAGGFGGGASIALGSGSGSPVAARGGAGALTLEISNVTFAGNTGRSGGGLSLYLGTDVQATVAGSTFYQNIAQYNPYGGPEGNRGLYGSGSAGGGLFAISYDGTNPSLTVDDTQFLENGSQGIGGGVAVQFGYYGASVSLNNATITGNQAVHGGGISILNPRYSDSSEPGSVSIADSTIANNTAYEIGGGIAGGNDETLDSGRLPESVERPWLERLGVGTAENRGRPSPGVVSPITINGSTISGNTAGFGGGVGLVAAGSRGLDLVNSTVSGNAASGGAGGIAVDLVDAYMVSVPPLQAGLSLITVAQNQSSGVSPAAGGLYFDEDSTARVVQSVVADNSATSGYNDGYGTFEVDFSLIEDPTGWTITGNDNLTGVDPQLGPLADNAGPTLTHLPSLTSPVINAGDPGFAGPPGTDQRGLPRVVGTAADMGSVEVQATPSLTVAPDPAAFGAVKVGETAGPVTVTLSNSGTPLDISAIGTANAPFAGTGGTCSPPLTLFDGESCSLDYTFSPGAAGSFSQSIAVTSTDADGPDQFELTGQGVLGTLNITPGSLDFGMIEPGDTSPTELVTLSNSGDAEVVVSNVDSPSAPFITATGGNCGPVPITIPPSDDCTLAFAFAPGGPGDFSQALSVTSDADSSPDTISLQGSSGEAVLSLSATDFEFDTVLIGVNEGGLVTLTNTGSADLQVSGFNPPDAPFGIEFGSAGLCPEPTFELSPSQSCDVRVSFSPFSPGEFSGSFDILSNAESSPDSVSLSGAAMAPAAVPLLDRFGMLLLSGLLGLAGWLGLRRRRETV